MKNHILTPGTGIIYMKIGTHAQESLEEIMERKRLELKQAGLVFWGYGGGTCHPLLAVQPFVKEQLATGNAIYLAMKPMDSKHRADPTIAQEYSEDCVKWKPVPKHVEVRGSRYALVLGSLDEEVFDLDLARLTVAVGPKRGTSAASYVRGHVDKGCFIVAQHAADADENPQQIGVVSTIQKPYAVFLR